MAKKVEKNLWYKDAIIYELHIRAFQDSAGNGVGDFKGLVDKLDYLEDLGINTIWLLPFYPSPLKDDGYDVTDYCDVHPDYGTLANFKTFLKEAHNRGLKVIIELVLNHTSDQHPWFQRSRKARKGSKYKDYYVWSDSPEKYGDARVIFSDTEHSNWTWDPVAKAYYWHRFYSHQPDLNYENIEVQMEIFKAVDFWMKIGVDGFRLSSVPFLFEEDGTNCENLPSTHEFLKKLRKHVEKNNPECVLLAEANMWPEDSASYFGGGEECHMNFHYPLMPRLFMALLTENNHPIIDIIEQTPEAPENGQWCLFLRNHDEVGLEMVTEEEKDYLYKAYASDANTRHNIGIHRRLAPMMDNDRRKIELLYTLLFSLPGSPIIYYGDEIAMGDNVYLGDRHGVRTPMQWNADSNAGFSRANPQQLYLPVVSDPTYRYESVNVANQESNPSSILWWLKNTIAMRKRLTAFSRGEITFLESSNAKILAFSRSYQGQHIIVVSNLSKYSQATSLNLEAFKDSGLTEVFSQNKFLDVDQDQYPITIGPYGYFWFSVETPDVDNQTADQEELRSLQTDTSWEKFFGNYNEVKRLEKKILPYFLPKCRWFTGKAKTITKIQVDKAIPLKIENGTAFLLIVEVCYAEGLPEFYFLPVSFIKADSVKENVNYTPQSIVCRFDYQDREGFIIDSIYDEHFRNYLFFAIVNKTKIKMETATLQFSAGVFSKLDVSKNEIKSEILKADQSNTSVIYNNQYFFKFYRKVEKEINPDLEIVRFLSEKASFKNSPKFAGGIEYKEDSGSSIVFGLLQNKVENQGDAWNMTLDAIGRYFDRAFAKVNREEKLPKLPTGNGMDFEDVPPLVQELIGSVFYERVIKLGERTAEMHLALASDHQDPAFSPEYFNSNYQRSVYSSLRKLLKDRFGLLKRCIKKLSGNNKKLAEQVLAMESDILDCFSQVYKKKIEGIKTRVHGDYHLGQVLFDGKDFTIIDFEGEPGVSFSERRLKRSPYKDVAGMIRSFHYAAYGKILLNDYYRDKDIDFLENWAEQWYHYVSRFYLGAYLNKIEEGRTISSEFLLLVRIYLLEKAIYELAYELNSRPDWVAIPLRGICYLMEQYLAERDHG
ncbi:MAG: maltose alpha-D-glucosyltransferase [Bacteroidota bacterium]